MIVPMIRYGFLLYHRDAEAFLTALRERGVVDITLSDAAPSAELADRAAEVERLRRVAREMKGLKVEIPATEHNPDPVAVRSAVDRYERAAAYAAECRSAKERAEAARQEVEAWGAFDPKTIDRLAEQGVAVRFFETTAKAYRDEWEALYPIEVIRRTAAHVHFVAAVPIDQKSEELPIEALEVRPPAASAEQKEEEIAHWDAEIASAEATMREAAAWRAAVEQLAAVEADEVDFEHVRRSGDESAEGTLKIIEAWSPVKDRAAVEEFAQSQEVIYTAKEAAVEDNPPIQLKNHFFGRLYEPIAKLYMLPRYDELDLTPFFAPFFMIFFGMCFGDAGYGLLFIVVVLALWKKIPKNFKDFAWLALFLCSSAVVFGTLTGNFFGVELAKVPALVSFKEMFLNPNDIFYLSIALGGVQVLFGQVLRIFNRAKRGGSFVYGLSSLGWVLLFVSSLVAGFGLAGDTFRFESVAYLAVVGAAAVLILFFNTPKKNPFLNFGKGLYSVYEMATGVVGDLISYVRLFAIGLAGTVIAQVFNELSIGLSGDLPVVSWIVMGAILLIGHGLNVFVSALGAFVHPVRLTFVEFYKNAEFDGGGRAFRLFKRRANQ